MPSSRNLIVRSWTTTEDEKLHQLHSEGATLLRAASAVRRQATSVKKRAKILGIHFAGVREVRRAINSRETTAS
jgi:hypothetical protein